MNKSIVLAIFAGVATAKWGAVEHNYLPEQSKEVADAIKAKLYRIHYIDSQKLEDSPINNLLPPSKPTSTKKMIQREN